MLTVPDKHRRKGERADIGREPRYGFVDGTAYMLRRWRFYIAFFFGMACSSMVMLTISAWAPTYLARSFGLNPAEIGTRYGTLVLVFGLAGGIASPLISSGLGRWTQDPTMQTVRLGPFMLVAFAAALSLARSESVALLCLALLTFSYSFPMSMASTSLQLAAPPRLRGIASAYYFVIVSLIGYGIGPTAVPLVSEKLLGDPDRIGEAMAGIAVFFGLMSTVLISIAVRGFRIERDRARSEALPG
jgi:MFS family permease